MNVPPAIKSGFRLPSLACFARIFTVLDISANDMFWEWLGTGTIKPRGVSQAKAMLTELWSLTTLSANSPLISDVSGRLDNGVHHHVSILIFAKPSFSPLSLILALSAPGVPTRRLPLSVY